MKLLRILLTLVGALALVGGLAAGEGTLSNPNLAFLADVSASSEYGAGYEAIGATDGFVPEALAHG
ncbi:MAG: hypothetical protein IK077_13710, partial [Thermoguttaceae bacterium]|nr:hypothetical protein [Thermoguttaceae bacterium]